MGDLHSQWPLTTRTRSILPQMGHFMALAKRGRALLSRRYIGFELTQKLSPAKVQLAQRQAPIRRSTSGAFCSVLFRFVTKDATLPIKANSSALYRHRGGQAVSDAPTILIDCDGVIVDNVKFEQYVTNGIIRAYVERTGSTYSDGEARWRRELSTTRGDSRWYDYAFHASRIGLDGTKVARDAHYAARGLLQIVQGADKTLGLLQDYGLPVCVVTDATRWVVEFKLDALGLSQMLSIFSSTDADTTKAKTEYWAKLSKRYTDFDPRALIDNRQVNLSAAGRTFVTPHLVQFEKDEHVMTLSEAPTSERIGDEPIQVVVHNHGELQAWLKANIL